MDVSELINQSIKSLEKLPEDKIHEVVDFIDFLSKKYEEEKELQKGIEQIVSESKGFSFLNEEEEIYSEADLIERY